MASTSHPTLRCAALVLAGLAMAACEGRGISEPDETSPSQVAWEHTEEITFTGISQFRSITVVATVQGEVLPPDSIRVVAMTPGVAEVVSIVDAPERGARLNLRSLAAGEGTLTLGVIGRPDSTLIAVVVRQQVSRIALWSSGERVNLSPGDQAAIRARVYDGGGTPMPGVADSLLWNSTDPSVLQVTTGGVTAAGPGEAAVQVAYGPVVATLGFSVGAPAGLRLRGEFSSGSYAPLTGVTPVGDQTLLLRYTRVTGPGDTSQDLGGVHPFGSWRMNLAAHMGTVGALSDGRIFAYLPGRVALLGPQMWDTVIHDAELVDVLGEVDGDLLVRFPEGLGRLTLEGQQLWRSVAPAWRALVAPDGTLRSFSSTEAGAVDPNGAVLWTLPIGGRAAASDPSATLFLASDSSTVAISASGTVLWTGQEGGHRLVVGSYGELLAVDRRGLTSRSRESGVVRWFAEDIRDFSAAEDGSIYALTEEGRVVRLDHQTGAEIESLSLPAGRTYRALHHTGRLIWTDHASGAVAVDVPLRPLGLPAARLPW